MKPVRVSAISSSGFSRASTAASSPLSVVSLPGDSSNVLTLRVHRKLHSSLDGLYYRAVISPTSESWDMLAEYSDCELAGKGSYGEVVKAHCAGQGTVAVKRVEILEDNHASDWENGLRLVRELFFLKTLSHPNLCALLNVFPNNPCSGKLCVVNIVTKFCESGSLNQYVPKSLKEVLGIQAQILSALHHLHGNDILHRDVKRENIFVSSHSTSGGCPHVVLGDFGLSRSRTSSGMTAEVVTKPYRCPSLLLGETDYGAEIDVFAAGLVLLEMLTGKTNNTLLPNRKMGLKNFLRYQIALTVSDPSPSLSPRMLKLGERMHADLPELIESVLGGTDFDDKMAIEYSRQMWEVIGSVYLPSKEVLKTVKGMVAFDAVSRSSLAHVMSSPVFAGLVDAKAGRAVEGGVRESYDEEISKLETDEEKAAAVKNAIWNLLTEDTPFGSHIKRGRLSEAFSLETQMCPLGHVEPVAKRTRTQLRLLST